MDDPFELLEPNQRRLRTKTAEPEPGGSLPSPGSFGTRWPRSSSTPRGRSSPRRRPARGGARSTTPTSLQTRWPAPDRSPQRGCGYLTSAVPQAASSACLRLRIRRSSGMAAIRSPPRWSGRVRTSQASSSRPARSIRRWAIQTGPSTRSTRFSICRTSPKVQRCVGSTRCTG